MDFSKERSNRMTQLEEDLIRADERLKIIKKFYEVKPSYISYADFLDWLNQITKEALEFIKMNGDSTDAEK
jgi:hypothetical protein